MFFRPSRLLLLAILLDIAFSEDYNVLNTDGSYDFGYDTPDSYHHSKANRNNVVLGEFGGRNPKTGAIDTVSYTAGPRGFRPRGKNIVRKYDLNQNGPRPVGSRDDPYFDPSEDPSYNFGFKTRTYTRNEAANRAGDVTGKYSYLDDVGERHNVEYIAGKNTGFHVKTPFPDSNPRSYGPLFFNGRGRPLPRGRTSIQRGLDGSYRFVSAGPDQRRTETSDSAGNVRGSYTYLDDKGVQHSVHYIAGSKIGYRVLKNVKGPHLPSVFPFGGPNIVPSDFYNYLDDNTSPDLFDAAASGRPKPSAGSGFDDSGFDAGNPIVPGGSRPSKPSYEDDSGDDGGDLSDNLFGGGGSGTTARPAGSSTSKPDDGSYKPGHTDFGDDDDSGFAGHDDLFGGSSNRPRPTPRPGSGKPSRPITPRPSRPNYDDDDDGSNNDFGLFDDGSSTKPPQLTVTVSGLPVNADGSKHTIVTNVGDTIFTVPPGVSVHAHVQSIDLFPYESKVPSPSDQLRAEMSEISKTKLEPDGSTTASSIVSSTDNPTTEK